jgi:hypothetical protein
LSKVRCFVYNQYGHLAAQCPERKKKRKEKEGPVASTAATVEDFSDKFEKEFSLVTLMSSVRSAGFERKSRWIIDSGASCHMTGIWRIFLSISETGPDRLVESEGGMARAVRRVGRVIFQLEFGELLVVDGVMFVPGIRVNLLSVSALADAGYATLFKSGHIFIYREGADPVKPRLIGDRIDRLYIVRGQPTVGDSESDEKQEAPKTAVGPRIQSRNLREERKSLLSTDRRLSWCEWTEAQGGVDSPRSLGFRVVARRRYSDSSSVQVLRLAPSVLIFITFMDPIPLDIGGCFSLIPTCLCPKQRDFSSNTYSPQLHLSYSPDGPHL